MSGQSVSILSVGTALPGSPVDNAMLASRFHWDKSCEERIGSSTGISARHLGFDLETGKQHYSLVDLGSEASGKALWAARLRPDDIDLIVMGTSAPGRLVPSAVERVAARLGIAGVVTALQIRSGCTGAVRALSVARQLLVCGRHRNALVIGAEATANPYGHPLQADVPDPSRLVSVVILGDGAGAAILTTDPVSHDPAFSGALLTFAGSNHGSQRIVERYGAGHPGSLGPEEGRELPESCDGADEGAADLAAETCGELLEVLAWERRDIDFLLPPQTSGRTAGRVTEVLAVPHVQEITRVRGIGNTGNAAVFFQLQRLLPRMDEGDRALCISVESGRGIKAGFALEKRLSPV